MNNENIVWTNGSTFATGIEYSGASGRSHNMFYVPIDFDDGFINVPIAKTLDEYWLYILTFGTAAMYVSETGSEIERQKRKNDYVKTIIAYSDVNGLECYTGVCRRPRHSIKRSDTRTPASYRDPFAADFNWAWRKV